MDVETLRILVNRRWFYGDDGVRSTMTADDIAALVGVPAVNAVVEEQIARGTLRGVARDARIRICDGMSFLVTREFVMGG